MIEFISLIFLIFILFICLCVYVYPTHKTGNDLLDEIEKSLEEIEKFHYLIEKNRKTLPKEIIEEFDKLNKN